MISSAVSFTFGASVAVAPAGTAGGAGVPPMTSSSPGAAGFAGS